jgi:hypothetical protein
LLCACAREALTRQRLQRGLVVGVAFSKLRNSDNIGCAHWSLRVNQLLSRPYQPD